MHTLWMSNCSLPRGLLAALLVLPLAGCCVLRSERFASHDEMVPLAAKDGCCYDGPGLPGRAGGHVFGLPLAAGEHGAVQPLHPRFHPVPTRPVFGQADAFTALPYDVGVERDSGGPLRTLRATEPQLVPAEETGWRTRLQDESGAMGELRLP